MNRQQKLRFRIFFIISLVLFLPACGIIYQQDIQQGNVLTDEMLDNLQQGMSKTEVQYYIGTPLIEDPFHANRWDYFYAYQFGGDKNREQRIITLLFDDQERLADITGSVETIEEKVNIVSLPEDGELNTVVSDTKQKDESFWQSVKRRLLK